MMSSRVEVLRDRDDLGPRDHRLFDGRLRELKHLIDQLPLFLIDLAAFLRKCNELTKLVLGVNRSVVER